MFNIISSILFIIVVVPLMHGAFLIVRDKDREWHKRNDHKIEAENE